MKKTECIPYISLIVHFLYLWLALLTSAIHGDLWDGVHLRQYLVWLMTKVVPYISLIVPYPISLDIFYLQAPYKLIIGTESICASLWSGL